MNICALITLFLIMGGIFFYIWPRVQLVTLTYDYNVLKDQERELKKYNRLLKLELTSIRPLEKVENIAVEKMGMVVPEDKNVILVYR